MCEFLPQRFAVQLDQSVTFQNPWPKSRHGQCQCLIHWPNLRYFSKIYFQLTHSLGGWVIKKKKRDLTTKVRSPIGSVSNFSKSVAQEPTRPISMPRSLAKLPVCDAVSGSRSSVMVTSSAARWSCCWCCCWKKVRTDNHFRLIHAVTT